MKKTYLTPELEEIVFEIEAPILVDSEGGINDDGSANQNGNTSSDPSTDYGWGGQE